MQKRNGEKAQTDRSELKGNIYILRQSYCSRKKKKKQRNGASMDKNDRSYRKKNTTVTLVYLSSELHCYYFVVSVRLTRKNLSVEYIDGEDEREEGGKDEIGGTGNDMSKTNSNRWDRIQRCQQMTND